MSVKIEKNVPLPAKNTEWDFMDEMKKGDSVFLPLEDGDDKDKLQARIISAARYRDLKVSVRATEEKNKNGVRFWMTGKRPATDN